MLFIFMKQAKPATLESIKYKRWKEKEATMTSQQHYLLNGTNPTKLENILDVLIDEQFPENQDYATDPLTGLTWPVRV